MKITHKQKRIRFSPKGKSYFIDRILRKIDGGEPLSQEDYYRLFQNGMFSDDEIGNILSLFGAEEIANAASEILEIYKEEPKRISEYLNIWCPDLELEMIKYFRDHPEEMYSMAPRKFEELIAAIFKNHGFNVELTPATRDGGIDIIAVENSKLTGENVHLVECKRYARYKHVGIGIVQRLLGVVTQMQATKGIIVTTSFFTSDAKEAASNSKHVLTLRDYDVLVDWLNEL